MRALPLTPQRIFSAAANQSAILAAVDVSADVGVSYRENSTFSKRFHSDQRTATSTKPPPHATLDSSKTEGPPFPLKCAIHSNRVDRHRGYRQGKNQSAETL